MKKPMENNPAAREKKKLKPLHIILPVVLVAGGIFGFRKVQHALYYESTDNAQIESNAVPVVSRVAGYIDSVDVSDYAEVKRGQVVMTLDAREYQIAVAQAEADLAQAVADLAQARAALTTVGSSESVAVANADVLRTRLQKAESDLKRDEALYADGAITRKQVEDSRANVLTARKQVVAGNQQARQASVQGGTAQAGIQKAQALIETRRAALEKAKLQLTYVTVTAPSNGRIGKTNLQPGQYIQPGQPLFTIVNNEQFWVVANFKETQLEHLKVGQPVDIQIAGYPDQKLTGHITSFSEATGAKFSLLPPDNASGNYIKVTQRVPVRIDIDNVGAVRDILKAGLSVDLEVRVK
jgi:membrane fusion protein, multidrug efflux system